MPFSVDRTPLIPGLPCVRRASGSRDFSDFGDDDSRSKGIILLTTQLDAFPESLCKSPRASAIRNDKVSVIDVKIPLVKSGISLGFSDIGEMPQVNEVFALHNGEHLLDDPQGIATVVKGITCVREVKVAGGKLSGQFLTLARDCSHWRPDAELVKDRAVGVSQRVRSCDFELVVRPILPDSGQGASTDIQDSDEGARQGWNQLLELFLEFQLWIRSPTKRFRVPVPALVHQGVLPECKLLRQGPLPNILRFAQPSDQFSLCPVQAGSRCANELQKRVHR